MADVREDRSLRDYPLAELLHRLSQDTAQLVRQEIQLAKAELSEKGKRAGVAAGALGTAGIVGLGAFGAFTAFVVLALSTAMAAWIAALVVTIVYGLVAVILALIARRKFKDATPFAPTETMESIKEDVRWAKMRAESARR